ncbi:hypothetical protein [Pseudomonas sp. EMN2]|uniref:hypothetical protein n=1 Tax=Pseudomonas sp. EMN2 TaxID=2615212 RepID=UPI00129A7605|nr:hypothetical protein [Pseudomonas sp. EMN2]
MANLYGSDEHGKVFDLTFDELGENFLSGIIFTKIDTDCKVETTEIEVSLSDIFYFDIMEDPQEKHEVSIPSKTGINLDIEKLAHIMFGLDAPTVEYKNVSYEKYFGEWLHLKLGYLRDGDNCGTKPIIDSFDSVKKDNTGVPIYTIKLTKQKFLENFKHNILREIYFGEDTYTKAIKSLESSAPAISVDKQLGYLRHYLDSRTENTGETQFSFLLSQFNFRRVMFPIPMPDGKFGMMPSPLSSGAKVKASLPILLAIQGELDIQQIKIKSKINNLQQVDIQYSIHKPAVKNTFGAGFCSLPSNTRERMSAVEIASYERVSKALQANYCFHDHYPLEKDFVELASWTLKQVSYCLEEPSYLKNKAITWINDNRDKNYKNMEDDFFLPFLYERLRERFGKVIQKKPERFGGNVDVIFGEIPIELKVRRGYKEALIDQIVDEKYKPTSQAAAYAAITRLGCVMVLDLPTSEPAVTNISACIKVVTKKFPEADLPTSIVVFVFQCNTPKPSSAS